MACTAINLKIADTLKRRGGVPLQVGNLQMQEKYQETISEEHCFAGPALEALTAAHINKPEAPDSPGREHS